MIKQTLKVLGVLLCSILVVKEVKAVVAPGGPPVQGNAIQGNCTDGQVLRGSTYYGGSCAAVNSGWLQENGTGVGISNGINGSVIPANNLDINGKVEIGGGASPAANGALQLKVTPLNASTTGQIINSPASATADSLDIQNNGTNVLGVNTGSLTASPAVLTITMPNASSTGTVVNGAASATADLAQFQVNATTVVRINGSGLLTSPAVLTVIAPNASSTATIVNTAASPTADIQQWQVNGSTFARVGPIGGFGKRQVTRAVADTLTPDFVGEEIQISNYGGSGSNFPNNNFVDCVGSATAVDSWQVKNSTGGQGQNGCGVNR